MPIGFVLSKIFFYLIGLGLVLILNFSYAYFCRYFRDKHFAVIEKNLNHADKSLFPAFEFSTDYRDLKYEDRWLTYFIVTVPLLAVYIRCIYFDYERVTTGLYVPGWQVAIHAGAFLIAYLRYQRFAKILEQLKSHPEVNKEALENLISTDLRKTEVNQALNALALPDEKALSEKTAVLKLLNDRYTKLKAFF